MSDVWGEGDGGAQPIPVMVNGEAVTVAQGGDTLASVAQRVAAESGLRTFSVLVNGQKADTAQGSQALAALGATSVELVTKDSRG